MKALRVIPTINSAAVWNADGVVRVGLTNVDPNRPVDVSIALRDVAATGVTSRILTGPSVQSFNDFGRAETVTPAAFTGARVANGTLAVALPTRFVVMLELR